MKSLHVFLASSLMEFKRERIALRAFTADITDILDDYGFELKLFACEDFDIAIQDNRTQEKYNDFIRKPCDLFFSLYGARAGQYTVEELNIALEMHKKHNKPHICVGFIPDVQKHNNDSLSEVYALAKKSTVINNFDYSCDTDLRVTQLKLALLTAVMKCDDEIKVSVYNGEVKLFDERILILTQDMEEYFLKVKDDILQEARDCTDMDINEV